MKNGMVSLSDETALAKLEHIGQNKGLAFSFREGETIVFPPLSDACVSSKTWKDKTKKSQTSLYGMAHSDARGGQFDVPLAAFRRVPIESEREDLYEDNSLGEMLAQSNLSDIDRYKLLCGKTIRVVSVEKLHSPHFDWDAEKGEWARHPEKVDNLTCFKFEDITPEEDTVSPKA
jgi:hypothetical protein